MINASELRRGVVVELDGALYEVLDYQHVKQKRTALARVKLRDVRGGHTSERTFQSAERLVRARLELRDMQYLYRDGDLHYFMDQESFEQTSLSTDQLGEAISYMKESMSLQISYYKEEVIGVELPITVELAITATDPGFKGDTATGGTKPATLETGITVQVPLFVNQGDAIKVDTRTGAYMERAA